MYYKITWFSACIWSLCVFGLVRCLWSMLHSNINWTAPKLIYKQTETHLFSGLGPLVWCAPGFRWQCSYLSHTNIAIAPEFILIKHCTMWTHPKCCTPHNMSAAQTSTVFWKHKKKYKKCCKDVQYTAIYSKAGFLTRLTYG